MGNRANQPEPQTPLDETPDGTMLAAPQNEEPRLRQWPIALTGIVVLILFFFVHLYNPRFLNAIVLQSQDMLIARHAVPPQSDGVILIDIDDESLRSIGQWPWARILVAQMADRLWDMGANVLTFDVAFSEKDRLSPSNTVSIWHEVLPPSQEVLIPVADWPDFDRILADAVSRGPTVLGFYVYLSDKALLTEDGSTFPNWRGVFIERGHGREFLAQGRDLTPPIPLLREQASIGFISTEPDQDNIVRRSPLIIAMGGIRLYPALGLESARLALGASRFSIHYDDKGVAGVRHISIDQRRIPTDGNGRLTINYRSRRFATLSAADVLLGDVDPATVRGRVAIIGTSAVGLHDRYLTPLNKEISGAEIQATIIDNILAGDMLIEPRWMFFVNLGALVVGGIILTLIVIRTRAVLSLMVFLMALLAPLAISNYLMKHMQMVFIPTPLMIGWGLIYAAIIVMKYWQQEILARYDAKLRLVNRQLAEEISVRTAAEKTALAARTAALQAAAAKSEFLANMSHEIRTPMNSIIGMSDLALRTDLTGRQFNYIAKVRYSANALLRLINDILDFSKLEAGKLDVEHVEFDLDAVLDDILDLLGHKVAEKRIELILDCAPDVPRAVIGDPLRLRQVLINLAANAIKFTEKGFVGLRVGPAANGDGLGAGHLDMLFEVIDTGIGLTEAQQASLFQAFQQADASTTRKFGGTGLGLAISKNLVELMGGRIAVSSRPGEGSNFHFQLPLGRQPPDNEPVLNLPVETRGRLALVAGRVACMTEVIARDCRILGLRTETLDDPHAVKLRIAVTQAENTPDIVIVDSATFDSGKLAGDLADMVSGMDDHPPIILLRPLERDHEPGDAVTARSGSIRFVDKPLKSAAFISALRTAWGFDPLPQSAMWQTGEAPKIEPDRLKHARVLLVDDNPINREVATENMVIYGISVECAVNGREAVAKALSQAWNLILMDVQMPEMDGYEATREIRRLEKAGRTPRHRTAIIAMTANAMKEDEDRCRESGMDDYLSKPLEIDVFLRKLLQFIAQAEIAPPNDVPATAPPVAAEALPSAKPHTASNKAPEEEAGLPALAGVDFAAGLRRLQGNQKLFRRLLADFTARHGADPERMRQTTTTADAESARALAHAIKGSAANLGLTKIERLASDMDRLYKQSDPQSAGALIEPLQRALEELANALDGDDAKRSADCLASNSLTPVVLPVGQDHAVRQMIEELRQGNVGALDILPSVADILRQAGAAPAMLEDIQQAVETFDFEKAAILLARLTQQPPTEHQGAIPS